MSNLPPGVTLGMIPGNRPEDARYEAFIEAMEEALYEGGLNLSVMSDKQIERLEQTLEKWVMAECEQAVREARGDDQMERDTNWSDERLYGDLRMLLGLYPLAKILVALGNLLDKEGDSNE